MTAIGTNLARRQRLNIDLFRHVMVVYLYSKLSNREANLAGSSPDLKTDCTIHTRFNNAC